MSPNEVQQLRDQINSMEKKSSEQMNCMEKKLLQAIADIRVHLAEDYVTKSDQKWAVGITATISGIFFGIVSFIASWFKH